MAWLCRNSFALYLCVLALAATLTVRSAGAHGRNGFCGCLSPRWIQPPSQTSSDPAPPCYEPEIPDPITTTLTETLTETATTTIEVVSTVFESCPTSVTSLFSSASSVSGAPATPTASPTTLSASSATTGSESTTSTSTTDVVVPTSSSPPLETFTSQTPTLQSTSTVFSVNTSELRRRFRFF